MKISNIKSASDFIKEIEYIVKEKNIEYFEAVLYYCEMNNIEVETAASLVKQNSVLKARIQVEAENLNMVKRTSARLPIL
jgi:ribulose 1,5-bisphosphate carboxylase large subunit-like protein